MNPCDQHSVNILRYLENELHGAELEEFSAHVRQCVACKTLLEQERELSQLLVRTRPLYTAPEALRSRVADLTKTSAEAPSRTPRSVLQGIPRTWRVGVQWIPSWRVLAPATLVILLVLFTVFFVVPEVRATSYVNAALTTHHAQMNGYLLPQIRSDSPQEIAAWFDGKVPFTFRLPDSRSYPGTKPAYRLTGARVVTYNGNNTALVTYEAQQEKISLLVASSRFAVVAGGDELRFGDLTFHYHYRSGLKVITWSNHGLSYALVSGVAGSARQSCLVCHQNMKDRSVFETRD